MNITNFDKYFNHSNEPVKHHYLLPDCHYMIVGSTGQGKTNLLLNMLLKWMTFDICRVFTLNPDQDKYQFLSQMNGVDILGPDDVAPVDDLHQDTQKVIVFDDIKLDAKSMNKIKEYFSLSRNKRCNCIYLTQSYYDVPKYIRRNTNCFIFFRNLDNKDIRHIADDHAKGISKTDFEAIYHEATKDPYCFMMLDKTAEHKPLMYRKCFNQFYVDK